MLLPKSTPLRKSPKSSCFEFGVLRRFISVSTATFAILLSAVFTASLSASLAVANEAEPAAEHGAAEASSSYEKPACRWSEHDSRLTSYMAKIRTFEKEISDLIESKHHLENSERVKLLTQQISFKYADLAKVVREYETERLHVRFQHPDRDLEGDRKYSAHRLKSLDELEEAFGLDGRLDRIRKQVGIVFPASEPEVSELQRKPANVKAIDDEDAVPAGIHLVK